MAETLRDQELPETGQRDFDAYKIVVDLWARENPIKAAKLQVLLAVTAH